jgi:hypothetical protein
MDLAENLTGSVPEAKEPNSIAVENRFDQYAQNSTFRILARERVRPVSIALRRRNYSVTLSVVRALTA